MPQKKRLKHSKLQNAENTGCQQQKKTLNSKESRSHSRGAKK